MFEWVEWVQIERVHVVLIGGASLVLDLLDEYKYKIGEDGEDAGDYLGVR